MPLHAQVPQEKHSAGSLAGSSPEDSITDPEEQLPEGQHRVERLIAKGTPCNLYWCM